MILGALLAAACNSESVPSASPERSSSPICFSTKPVEVKSNLDVPTGQDYLIADGNSIGVFATWKSLEGVSTNVFNKLTVTCTDNGETANPRYVWDYSPHKYWRNSGKYYFRAVFPYDVNTQFGTDGTRIVTSYSMLADNYDLMVAGAGRDLGTENDTDDTSPVNFQFKHACAAVRVLFKKGTADANRYYYLNSFEMQNLRTVGILAYEGEDLTVNSWESAEFRSSSLFAWTAPSEGERINVPSDYESFKTVNTGYWVQWHYVIPQTLKGSDGLTPAVKFSVYVKQYESDGETLAYESTSPVYTTLNLPLTYTDEEDNTRDVIWEPGKTYTYYVEIQPGYVNVTVEVTDWDTYYVYVDDLIFD